MQRAVTSSQVGVLVWTCPVFAWFRAAEGHASSGCRQAGALLTWRHRLCFSEHPSPATGGKQ